MPPNGLSLKQRLAALSRSPSSPSSPYGSDSQSGMPASTKKKLPFKAPWGKRPTEQPESEEVPGSQEALQEVMHRMIFQAGVDYETRPMVVLNASALPDPRRVSYDLLLSRILSYLNLYVEADYTVVFFAAGGIHTPGWNWVWKAYRSLSRKYRKNLKQLYIVHSSFFSKMLFSLAGAIISPKFFRKIIYVSTLSELAQFVPLTQIDIPPAVYQENLKHEREITLPIPIRSNLFGVPLEDIMGYDGEKGGLPRVVRDCIQYLRESGLQEEGLFRRSPASAMLRAVQQAYDRGQTVSLDTFADPHLAAVLLKKYLKDLPDPIFSESLYPIIRRCPSPTSDPNDMSSVMYIRDTLLPELPPCVYILLSSILHLLHDVSLHSASNRMDAHNLSIVLSPNLVRGSDPLRDVQMCSAPAVFASTSPPTSEGKTTLGMVVKICIQRYYEIFDEIRDRSEAVPPAQDGAASSEASSASDSPPRGHVRHLSQPDDDSIDDTMLVMPIGPSHSQHLFGMGQNGNAAPPSSWSGNGSAGLGTTGNSTFKPRHRSNLSGSSSKAGGVRSTHTAFGETGNGNGYSPSHKAKSTISIEKGATMGPGKRGSIAIGRGTMSKASASGVEAVGITAEGFFSPPTNSPPVPPVPKRGSDQQGGG